MSKENADKEQKRSFKREAFSWIACIVVTILLTEFILNFVIINANIPSGSMENTIMTNDKLIALRTSYWFKDPKRGDIIIFKYPDDETEWFIKRVIALPGETVLVKDGKVYTAGDDLVLDGITRMSVIRALKEEGVDIVFTPIKDKDIYSCDALFISATSMGAMSLSSVNGKSVKTDFEFVKRICKKVREWEL